MTLFGTRSQGNARAILGNPVYIGTAYSGDYRNPNAHEAIVPLELFSRVQRKLAARAKVTQGYIAQLETGTRRRLSLEVADRLARALGVGVTDLLK